MNKQTQAQHHLPVSFLDDDDEGYIVYVDDESEVSALTCSLFEHPASMKRSRKSMDLPSIFNWQDDRSHKRRRRGTSYTMVEIRSLLHLMKRVLPKTPDEWELIRVVHCHIFPDNDRTVQSLKRKFKDLCRDNNGPDALDERFRAQPVQGKKEVEKAREVQHLISLKPPGFQLILPKTSDKEIETLENARNSIPAFRVKVPNPLEPEPLVTQQQEVPKFVQIPESPDIIAQTHTTTEDDMSDLEIDEPDKDEESVILSPFVGTVVTSTGIHEAPSCVTSEKKFPVIITDQR